MGGIRGMGGAGMTEGEWKGGGGRRRGIFNSLIDVWVGLQTFLRVQITQKGAKFVILTSVFDREAKIFSLCILLLLKFFLKIFSKILRYFFCLNLGVKILHFLAKKFQHPTYFEVKRGKGEGLRLKNSLKTGF